MATRTVTLASVAIRIGFAILLGGFLGMERGLKNRPAGLRTYMLVCLGSCLIMVTNQYVYQFFGTGDPVRMGAQVVNGIGFLGAGTIVVTQRNQIRGLTTAAGLWAAAAAGLAIGVGFYEAALIGGFGIYLVLTLLQSWDNRMHRTSRIIEVCVELTHGTTLGSFMRGLQAMELEISNIQMEQDSALEASRIFTMTLKSRKKRNHAELFHAIRQPEGVAYLEEL